MLNSVRQHNRFITQSNYIGYMFQLLIIHLQAYFNWFSHKMLCTHYTSWCLRSSSKCAILVPCLPLRQKNMFNVFRRCSFCKCHNCLPQLCLVIFQLCLQAQQLHELYFVLVLPIVKVKGCSILDKQSYPYPIQQCKKISFWTAWKKAAKLVCCKKSC